jgi:hypothetical protein
MSNQPFQTSEADLLSQISSQVAPYVKLSSGVEPDAVEVFGKAIGLGEKKKKPTPSVTPPAFVGSEKVALDVEPGGLPSRMTASTLGRVGGLLNLILTRRALHNPQAPGNAEKHKETAESFERVEPEALKDVVLRLGGTRTVDDVLLKKNRNGEQDPWYKRLGGRVWHNPHTSVLGKAYGSLATPLANVGAALQRGSHYNPFTNAIAQYMDEPAVTEHELGHAIDFNTIMGKPSKHFLTRQMQGIGRDAYSAAYMQPFVPAAKLWHEGQANILSARTMHKAYADRPEEERERQIRRWEVLPAGYGSYLGNAINPASALPTLAGILGGKVLGMGVGAGMRANDALNKPKSTPKTEASSAAPKKESEEKAANYPGCKACMPAGPPKPPKPKKTQTHNRPQPIKRADFLPGQPSSGGQATSDDQNQWQEQADSLEPYPNRPTQQRMLDQKRVLKLLKRAGVPALIPPAPVQPPKPDAPVKGSNFAALGRAPVPGAPPNWKPLQGNRGMQFAPGYNQGLLQPLPGQAPAQAPAQAPMKVPGLVKPAAVEMVPLNKVMAEATKQRKKKPLGNLNPVPTEAKEAGLYVQHVHSFANDPKVRAKIDRETQHVADFRNQVTNQIRSNPNATNLMAGGSTNFQDDVVERLREKFPGMFVEPGGNREVTVRGPRRFLGLIPGKKQPLPEGYILNSFAHREPDDSSMADAIGGSQANLYENLLSDPTPAYNELLAGMHQAFPHFGSQAPGAKPLGKLHPVPTKAKEAAVPLTSMLGAGASIGWPQLAKLVHKHQLRRQLLATADKLQAERYSDPSLGMSPEEAQHNAAADTMGAAGTEDEAALYRKLLAHRMLKGASHGAAGNSAFGIHNRWTGPDTARVPMGRSGFNWSTNRDGASLGVAGNPKHSVGDLGESKAAQVCFQGGETIGSGARILQVLAGRSHASVKVADVLPGAGPSMLPPPPQAHPLPPVPVTQSPSQGPGRPLGMPPAPAGLDTLKMTNSAKPALGTSQSGNPAVTAGNTGDSPAPGSA